MELQLLKKENIQEVLTHQMALNIRLYVIGLEFAHAFLSSKCALVSR